LLSSATQLYFDATFKVEPTIYYQLFSLFVPFADFAFPVCYALMSRKATELYVKVFQNVQQLVPQFASTRAMADFEKGRRQQQQRGRGQSGAPVSSDDFSGVGISNGGSCINLRRLLRRVPRGATCWLRTGAVRTCATVL